MKLSSIQTKGAGAAGLILSVAYIAQAIYSGQEVSGEDWALFGALVSAAIGNLRSRQQNVSSEQAGAKP
jgi:hypothetical protein